MQVLLNDLSLHGQFPSLPDFQIAMRTLMQMRHKIRQFGRELYCHRNMAQAQVTHDLNMRQAIQCFNLDERRAVMGWLTQHGPFWDETRQHSGDDYLECHDQVATDTALGEAATRCFGGGEYHLLSVSPSNWLFTPLRVVWQREDQPHLIDVVNHWDDIALETALRATAPTIQSWRQLAETMPVQCPYLTFADDSFTPLHNQPFAYSATQRIIELLTTLDKLKRCFDAQGQRTAEGHRLYQDHFTGDKAWFSDSSDTEQREFAADLTFWHPERETERLFCPWHGKIKTPQFRIHFSFPMSAHAPVYVVYIGPKITKR